MIKKTEMSESSPLTDSRLRLLYIAGIALNLTFSPRFSAGMNPT
jgi:hypothetical protein